MAGEDVGRARPQPELLAEPERVGEVVQGDDRLEAAVDAHGEDLGVALEGGVVVGARAGLEPGPLDRQAEGVAADGGGTVEGLFGVAPEVTGQAGAGGAAGALPGGPVVVRLAVAVVAALDLVARRGHADGEALAQQAGRPWSAVLRRSGGSMWRSAARHPFSLAGAAGVRPAGRAGGAAGAVSGPGGRAHAGQRRRDDVDLVAGVAHQRAHLRLGGVAAGPHGRRLHVACRADDLGHLAAHVGLARPGGRRRSSRSRPSSSSATPLQRAAHRGQLGHGGVTRLGVGHGDLGVLDGDPQAPAHPGRRARLRSSGVARPAIALPAGAEERQRGQQAADQHVPVQQPPVPADVAAGDEEGRHQAPSDHDHGRR